MSSLVSDHGFALWAIKGEKQKAAASPKWCFHHSDTVQHKGLSYSPSVKLPLGPDADRVRNARFSPWGSSLTTASMFSPFTYSELNPSEK